MYRIEACCTAVLELSDLRNLTRWTSSEELSSVVVGDICSGLDPARNKAILGNNSRESVPLTPESFTASQRWHLSIVLYDHYDLPWRYYKQLCDVFKKVEKITKDGET